MDNVVRFQSPRSRLSSERTLGEPIEGLRALTRVPLQDRVLLAARLGEAAARLNGKPLTGARAIFNEAWGESADWLKRKRYLRLYGEKGADPRDEGSYAASGRSWARIVEATARLLASPDRNDREVTAFGAGRRARPPGLPGRHTRTCWS